MATASDGPPVRGGLALILGAVAPSLLTLAIEQIGHAADRRVGPAFLALVAGVALVAGMRAAMASIVSSLLCLWLWAYPPDPAAPLGLASPADLALFGGAAALTGLLIARLEAARAGVARASQSLVEFVDRAPIGIALLDRDLRFERVNPTLAEIDGVAMEDHVGRRLGEMPELPPLHDLEARMAEMLDGGPAVRDLLITEPTPGAPRRLQTFRISAVPLGPLDAPTGAAGLVSDTTAATEAERRVHIVASCATALARAATPDQVATDLARVVIGSIAPSCRVALTAADGSLQLAADGLGGSAGAALDPDGDRALETAARTGAAVERPQPDHGGLEVALPLTFGPTGERWGAVELTWPEAEDLPAGHRELCAALVTLAVGALERIRAVEQLTGDTFRAALDAMIDDVSIAEAVRGPDGEIVDFVLTHANSSSRDGAGRGPEDMIGERVSALYPGWAESGMMAAFIRVVETGEPLIEDQLAYQDRTEDGRPISGYWRLQVVPFGDGYLATSRDITAEVALREMAARDAERAGQERVAVQLLQDVSLPTELPTERGLDLAAEYLPAKADAPVGGDWYDVFETEEGYIALVVGDVAGHGRTSAAQMLQARTITRAVAEPGRDSGAVLRESNRLLEQLWRASTFATCVVCLVDPATSEVRVARAGHPPIVIVGPDGASAIEVPGGPPLGVMPGARFPITTVTLAPGQSLLLYSDGLVEGRDRPVDVGVSEMLSLIEDRSDLSALDLCRLIISDVEEREREDDVCLLVARRQAVEDASSPSGAALPSAAMSGRPMSHAADGETETYDATRLRLPAPNLATARTARRWAQDWLDRTPNRASPDDLLLVLSELVENARRHASGAIEVTLRRVGDGVRTEVSDESTVPPRRVEADQTRAGGRGMLIVDTLSLSWGVEVTDGGKTVWAELPPID